MTTQEGGCLCGGVRYRVTGPLSDVTACHCQQCRRSTGHVFANTDVAREDLKLVRDETLRHYESSPGIHRSFCGICGSTLFWERLGSAQLSIAAGTLDGPTGLKLVGHIFTAFKGDYYELEPGPPQYAEWPPKAD